MTSLSEELKNRKPDVHTLAWFQSQIDEVKKGYRGATHAMNKVLAENEDISRWNAEILARLEVQAEEIKGDRAKIGELQARVEKMAEFLNKLKPTLTQAAKKD